MAVVVDEAVPVMEGGVVEVVVVLQQELELDQQELELEVVVVLQQELELDLVVLEVQGDLDSVLFLVLDLVKNYLKMMNHPHRCCRRQFYHLAFVFYY